MEVLFDDGPEQGEGYERTPSFGDSFGFSSRGDSFGDFSSPMKKPTEDAFDSPGELRPRLQASGFSWNKAKMVRMLSCRSLQLEDDEDDSASFWSCSGSDELSTVHSVGTHTTEYTQASDNYTNMSHFSGDQDPVLAEELEQLSQTELSERFAKLQTKLDRRRRKLVKTPAQIQRSKRNSLEELPPGMVDTIKTSKVSSKSSSSRMQERERTSSRSSDDPKGRKARKDTCR